MSLIPFISFCNISNRGRLRLTGEDRVRFLNGQVTNDVKILVPGKGCYATFTNAKGKMRADVVILNVGDSLLLDLESGCDARIAAELDKFIIADDVVVENLTESWKAYTVIGEEAARVLQQTNLCSSYPGTLWDNVRFADGHGFIFKSHRAKTSSFDLWIEASQAVTLENRLMETLNKSGDALIDPSVLEILRIEAGIPRFGVEMDENTLPPEAGLESVAISYTKGCYLGQEVIARIKSIGHVNKVMARLKLPENTQPGSPLSMNSKEVGKVGSAVNSPRFGRIGLAIIRREAASPGTKLSLPQGDAQVVEDFI